MPSGAATSSAKKTSNASAVDAADDFAGEPSIGERMVAEGSPRIVEPGLRGQSRRQPNVIGQIGDSHRRREARQSRSVAKDIAHPDVRLAEFGPVATNRRIKMEEIAVDEDKSGHRDKALGAGENQLERILPPRSPRRPIGDARPQVDARLAP